MTAASSSPSGRPTILLVDDEPEILVALQDLLEDDYRVLTASSPIKALALVNEHPDLAVIVSDQRMPEESGNVFLAKARACSDAEAILLTGYADLSAVISAVNDGAISGYAHKPWEPEALRTMIAAAAERHRLRRALAFEQSAFAALMQGSTDSIWVLDRNRNPVRTNVRAQEGSDRDADPEGRAAEDAADATALETGVYSEIERQVSDDGAVRWIRTRRIPFGEQGVHRHLLKIESDETKRKLAEQKFHQAEKLQALGTLAGGIAHDFNNLLAVVIGNLELAGRSNGDPAKLSRYLASATDAATRGSAISRRLLTFSRQRDLAAETFCPETAIREIESLIVQSMAGRATVRLDLESGVWPVRTDPSQFELAIVNLCINARDAMPDGGEVTIRARKADAAELPEGLSGDFARISVIDEGSGMSKSVLQRVFEPFFTTKPQGHGTGLGLPMVRAMAEAAGGTVTIDSVEGKGSSIHLWLPRDTRPTMAELSVSTQAPSGPLRILLAEDDAEVRDMVSAHLVQAGHAIVAVNSGHEALELLAQDAAFDLLITDFAMPRLSGLDLSKQVNERWSRLPVLLVTGFAEIHEELSVPLLSKPFTADQLATAVADAIRRRTAD